ncbi:Transmembrane emp24 domain-containing protein 7 [Acropora cervicornis]|uniref:Transmembrane emp24 domain-containing protein 7 n=1 Tax=Acropora cervicornis TaxID=6130 RepID=A0AAD9V3Z3_ACRCE|nr:Transmembrane emp24 domain-containing protein 7 [Acropora cervicornis]
MFLRLNAVILALCLCLFSTPVNGRHLQFLLSGFECFYEDLMENTDCSLEYAPITGADPRIDVFVQSPDGEYLYKEVKKDYDLHKFKVPKNGTYTICFSNVFEFSIGENLVYFDLIKDDEGYDGVGDGSPTALTHFEKSFVTIHENFNLIERYQNYHRLREANGRVAAEYLSQRVQWWSAGQSFVIVMVGFVQVYVLRRFFTVAKEEL